MWLIIKDRTREVLIAIYVLTIIDVISTIVGIKIERMTEANVLMDHVFRALGYELTGIIILITVGCGLVLIYKVKDKIPWLPAALMFILVIKILIVILHSVIWTFIIWFPIVL